MEIMLWPFVGFMFGLVAVRRPNPRMGHDRFAFITAFVIIIAFWPLWLLARMMKGWRFRHPRKIKLN